MAKRNFNLASWTKEAVNSVLTKLAVLTNNLSETGTLPFASVDLPITPANRILASPDAATATKGLPTFRALTATDIPTLTLSKISDFTALTVFTPTRTAQGGATWTAGATACAWFKIGTQLFIEFAADATTVSGATNYLQFTIPNSFTAQARPYEFPVLVIDNGGAAAWGRALIGTGATTIQIYTTPAGGAWAGGVTNNYVRGTIGPFEVL